MQHALKKAKQMLVKPAPEPPSLAGQDLLCHVDAAYTTNGRQVLVFGWAEDLESCELFLAGSASTAAPTRLDCVVVPRHDVSEYLAARGRPVMTDRHGFYAALDRCWNDAARVRLCMISNETKKWSGDIAIEVSRVSLAKILATTLTASRNAGGSLSENFERLTRPLVENAGFEIPPKVVDVRIFNPAGLAPPRQPRTSVIIPFYGDATYLLDHLLSQEKSPDDVEWIFVCDDPRLSATLLHVVNSRQSELRQRTCVVCLGSNGGYAHANNVGLRYAHGKYLLLMNSDVYCSDFEFLARGIDLLEGDSEIGCVGFSMQFEDGTVQHDGIRFGRAPWLDGLWACGHPGKGLPPAWREVSSRRVDAVTAALMLLRRADAGKEIFDPRYLAGDFEDADYCMRLREQGRSVALLRTDRVWHLERQSIRHMADEDGRLAVTLLNGLRFNARWGAVLDRTCAQEGVNP